MPKTESSEKILRVDVVVGCLIFQDNKYLLVQEKSPNIYGLWNLPAGKVEVGQTLLEAAIREAMEETGFDVEIIKELGIYHKDGDKSVKHVFEAKIIGGQIEIPEDEILDVKWLSKEEITELNNKDMIRNDWIIKAIESYL